MSKHLPSPLVGLPCDSRVLDGQTFHVVGDKYARAVAVASQAIPMLIPAFVDLHDAVDLVRRLDGLMLTGSPSNVHPRHYNTPSTAAAEPFDEARDATTLPLIQAALSEGVPLLAICRGFQELNVLLGGTLHPRVHELPGRMDHRRPSSEELDVQYGPRHEVNFIDDGAFAQLAGTTRIEVNSLHWQALDQVADALVVEGVAPDGTIEAVSVRGARAFALGVQWHPEYKALENAFSTSLFTAFGDACRDRVRARMRASAA